MLWFFLDAIASPSTYPRQSVIVSDLEIAIASLSFASLFLFLSYMVFECEYGSNPNREVIGSIIRCTSFADHPNKSILSSA